CFNKDPSVNSSLKFLRNNPWARTEVENLYLDMLDEKTREENSPWAGRK
ncbi:MAG: VF530 family DNA-binding protein, partial [Mariprofundaceae bacterium]|nr:VF530 family DNA-binding protein [Mariprofundaceae bacterium]